MKLRHLVIFVVAAATISLGVAAASTLSTSSHNLGSQTATVGRCDNQGFTFALGSDDKGNLTSVTVNDKDLAGSTCNGQKVQLTVLNGAGNVIAQTLAPVTVTGTSTVVTNLSASPDSSTVGKVYAVVSP